MRLLAWDDGTVVEAAKFSLDRPFVLQRIHTLRYKVYNIALHIELLREASVQLFGFATLCDPASAERIIVKLLELSRVSSQLSCPVAMRIDCDGRLSFEVENPLYESGIQLKATRLDGLCMCQQLPSVMSQTSASIAFENLMQAMVEKQGADIAIGVDAGGSVISLPWRPIFTIYNGKVYTPSEFSTVEYLSVRKAIELANLELIVRDIPQSSLERMDEVFLVDAMSVLSLASINKHRLLSVTTQRIVNRMEPK